MVDIKEFLNQLDNIRSFNGKIKYADQNLERLGSGSGRIVYSIGDDRVLKLAKNTKGIAQNKVEAGIGGDYTAKHIVTEVFDSADDNSWVLAEKAKKVTEKRIKEVTGIPSLWELQKFLHNQVDRNKGRNTVRQDQELVDFFWENEFASDLITFVSNYGQLSGDMGRPSTYGEVIKDGQPAIVLTDYGLNDEVFNTHYLHEIKSKYNLYELHHAGVSYDDHLADIGNVSQEVRHGMWALVPAGVGDGDEINEEYVDFVLDRPVYPEQATDKIPILTDIFHSNLNNLQTIIKSVEDPIMFIKNLIALQNYLVSHNSYDRDLIGINDKPELNEEILKEGVKREVADVIANKIAQKRGYQKLDYLGGGMFGAAYDIGDDKVLKLTSDHTEANENMHLRGKNLKHIAKPYEVSKINMKDDKDIYIIVLEKLETDPSTFEKHADLLNEFFEENIGRGYADVIGDYMHYGWNDEINTVEYRNFMKNNPETAKFFQEILNIADEVKQYGIGSMDFVSPNNLGYKKDGTLAFFDVGFSDYFQPISQKIQNIDVDENFAGGGGTKFTTSDNVSSDGFSTYDNTADTSPSIRNNLDANSSLYNEDLEYNHVDDATKDNFAVGLKNSSTFANINENISTLQQLPFISEIKSLGGKIYSVGGAVRDEFLGKESKDLDVLITGIPLDELGQILSKYGVVKLVGESFGVYKFIPEGSNEEIDIAIPRTETPTGNGGHKDFHIKSDHTLPIEKDLIRRDFTINAIAKDIDGNIIDPYNGQEDLKNKVIRAVNPDAFSDDPLRMLRAVRFASRLGFTIEPHTMEMIKNNLDSVDKIAMDRRFGELEKIQKGGNMRYGAQLLKDSGLFRKLFGYELNQSIIDNAPFNKVKTVGEFIFLLLQESQTPEELFRTRIYNNVNIYKEIKALNIGHKININHVVAARSIAHNMYIVYPKSLESNILPNLIKKACNDLLHGKYPKTVNELAVNGNDLMKLGLQGKAIRDMQNKLLLAVYADKIINNKEELIDMVKKNQTKINEELDVKRLDKTKKNIPIQYTGIVIDDLRKDRLLIMFNELIPDDWEVINENMHVTIKLGALDDFDPMKYHLNFPMYVKATHIGISDKAIALRVETPSQIKSKNKIPHITLAYNKNGGAKPKDSNDITDWQELKRPLNIRGVFREVPYKFNI